MSATDNEIQAMAAIAEIVEGLGDVQRERVIRYIAERFNIADAASGPKSGGGGSQKQKASEARPEFEDFASLVDATQPETDSMRALVAGYWLQVCQGAPSFDAQSANNELKHLGHAASNITVSLSGLISQKPALVLQLRKSGSSKQARKLYKVTEAGVRKVKKMMSGDEDSE